MKSCEGCIDNEQQIIITKAKEYAARDKCQYVVYKELGEWKCIKREYAVGIPYKMVFSHFAT